MGDVCQSLPAWGLVTPFTPYNNELFGAVGVDAHRGLVGADFVAAGEQIGEPARQVAGDGDDRKSRGQGTSILWPSRM